MQNSKERILQALEQISGVWRSTGSMVDGSAEITGTDTYEWMPGKQFMIHRADVTVGGDKVDVIEIIGEYDETKESCAMHAFQSDGSHGVMQASINEDGSLLFAGDNIRATLTANPGSQTMDAKWERLDGGQWQHWMDMHFAKASTQPISQHLLQ